METKHTKGEWNYSGEVQLINGHNIFVGGVYPVSQKYIGPICSIQSCDHIRGITKEESEANAKLIAEAPELLNMLIHAVAKFEEMGMGENHDTIIYKSLIKKATE